MSGRIRILAYIRKMKILQKFLLASFRLYLKIAKLSYLAENLQVRQRAF